jgi:hypothetical protein
MEAFLFPIYGPRFVRRAFYEIGLTAYDRLGSTASAGRHRHLGLDETLAYAPNLVCADLRGALLYHDAIEDDARFTLAVVGTAIASGQGAAVAITRARATGPLKDGDRVIGGHGHGPAHGGHRGGPGGGLARRHRGLGAHSRIARSGPARSRSCPRVAEIAGGILRWDADRRTREVAAYLEGARPEFAVPPPA